MTEVHGGAGLSTGVATRVRVVVLCDRQRVDQRLRPGWGFSCLVEVDGRRWLFDTAESFPLLRANAEAMGIDLGSLEAVFLSHFHGDQVGGLWGLLKHLPPGATLYVLSGFPRDLERRARGAKVVRIRRPQQLAEGVFTTGRMGHTVEEQALVVRSGRGLVVITACAHPGVPKVVQRARTVASQREVDLLIGGVHLFSYDSAQAERLAVHLRELGVRRIAPAHCTGSLARRALSHAFGSAFLEVGAGAVLEV